MAGRDGAVTVEVTVAVAVPPAPVAVKVYVVLEVGNTALVPERGTAPISGDMERLAA